MFNQCHIPSYIPYIIFQQYTIQIFLSSQRWEEEAPEKHPRHSLGWAFGHKAYHKQLVLAVSTLQSQIPTMNPHPSPLWSVRQPPHQWATSSSNHPISPASRKLHSVTYQRAIYGLLSQHWCWINSTVHNLGELAFLDQLCDFCCYSMHFVVMLDLISTIIQLVTVTYVRCPSVA